MAKKKWGVVPYRIVNGKVEVLIISTRNDNWGLPKGNLIKKIGGKGTASQEAYEEAGIVGYIDGKGESFKKGGAEIFHFYPMMVWEEFNNWPEKEHRSRMWVSPNDARKMLNCKAHRKAVAKFAA
jgi:8-oxo-dGTP pyrophosphatase MutT (NUDIX family)